MLIVRKLNPLSVIVSHGVVDHRLDIYESVSEETSRKTDKDCDKIRRKEREREREPTEGNIKKNNRTKTLKVNGFPERKECSSINERIVRNYETSLSEVLRSLCNLPFLYVGRGEGETCERPVQSVFLVTVKHTHIQQIYLIVVAVSFSF